MLDVTTQPEPREIERTSSRKVLPMLERRSRRLARIVRGMPLRDDTRLVKVVQLSAPTFARLQGAAATYVWQSLSQAYPTREFVLSADVLEAYADLVVALPNRTPNGVLLPRRETFLAFNLVQQALVGTLIDLGIVPRFSACQMPCNVRIASGVRDAAAEQRPYASSKVHADLWYGEPLAAILMNVPLLGDAASVGLDFFEVESFPPTLMRVLGDYEEGRALADGARRLPIEFAQGGLYVSDALALHQTTKRGPGIRLSLDFRCIARELLPGEDDGKPLHKRYVDPALWKRSGSTLILGDGYPIDAFQRRAGGEAVAPAALDIVSIDDPL
jgi:hypothetical protein